jgi:putative transposase
MGQSLVKNYVHIVFSTKHREPLIYPPHDVALYEYIAGICNKLECDAIQVGGYLDHVHILCSLSKKIPMMTLLEKVKANSSKWFKGLDKELEHFYWQDGYAAFSVSSSQLPNVKGIHCQSGRSSFEGWLSVGISRIDETARDGIR